MRDPLGLEHVEILCVEEVVVTYLHRIADATREPSQKGIQVIEEEIGFRIARLRECPEFNQENADTVEIGRERLKETRLKKLRIEKGRILLSGSRSVPRLMGEPFRRKLLGYFQVPLELLRSFPRILLQKDGSGME